MKNEELLRQCLRDCRKKMGLSEEAMGKKYFKTDRGGYRTIESGKRRLSHEEAVIILNMADECKVANYEIRQIRPTPFYRKPYMYWPYLILLFLLCVDTFSIDLPTEFSSVDEYINAYYPPQPQIWVFFGFFGSIFTYYFPPVKTKRQKHGVFTLESPERKKPVFPVEDDQSAVSKIKADGHAQS